MASRDALFPEVAVGSQLAQRWYLDRRSRKAKSAVGWSSLAGPNRLAIDPARARPPLTYPLALVTDPSCSSSRGAPSASLYPAPRCNRMPVPVPSPLVPAAAHFNNTSNIARYGRAVPASA